VYIAGKASVRAKRSASARQSSSLRALSGSQVLTAERSVLSPLRQRSSAAVGYGGGKGGGQLGMGREREDGGDVTGEEDGEDWMEGMISDKLLIVEDDGDSDEYEPALNA